MRKHVDEIDPRCQFDILHLKEAFTRAKLSVAQLLFHRHLCATLQLDTTRILPNFCTEHAMPVFFSTWVPTILYLVP